MFKEITNSIKIENIITYLGSYPQAYFDRCWKKEFMHPHAFSNRSVGITEFILVSNYISRLHASNVSTILTTPTFKKAN